MSKTNKPLGRKDEIVIQEIDGEVLIYDLRNDKAFCLNATSAAIWKLCDGDKSVADIASRVAADFKATNSEDLVWLALDQLKKEKLIDGGLDKGYDHFNGLSRRQVIKNIGMGSMVAIPIVASLLAPTAVYAQTCVADLGMCTVSPGCCSMVCVNTPGAGSTCCQPGGSINVGNDAGAPVSTPGNCGGTPNATRNAVCNAVRGPACCTGMAVYDGNGCAGNPATFDCDCA